MEEDSGKSIHDQDPFNSLIDRHLRICGVFCHVLGPGHVGAIARDFPYSLAWRGHGLHWYYRG